MSRRSAPDAGMSLVEVMVALVLFALLSTSILTMVVRSLDLTHEDASRVAATNLAVRELEITRDVFASTTRGPDRIRTNRVVNGNPLPNGVVGQPLVVDGDAYTVERTAQWIPVGAGAVSACDEGSTAELAQLRVAVEVSWPALGDRPPVRMTTSMTPPKGTYSALTGHIGIKVVDRLGEPVAGVTVSARSSSGALRTGDTADDGCALLSFLDAGTWTVSLGGRAGWVSPSGDSGAAITAQVQQGQLWRGTLAFDRAAGIDVAFTTLTGHQLPLGVNEIPVSLGNSALVPSGSRTVAGTTSTRQLRNLWPYPSGYQVWAGNCLDNDPGDRRTAPAPAEPGQVVATTVALAPLTVRTPNGSYVYATHVRDSSCQSDVTVVLGPSAGQLRSSLPYGTWRVSRTGSNAVTRSVVLEAPDPEASTVPVPPTVDLS